ncbi:FG-GAP repeat domain-containing protein [Agrilutibacter solisilvae]|uniref:VCBS repeat-containing protein n=1 Tax=Agrilutibacter solisilvae TaxID=2763317 RepID=A0A974XY44_9GAMM|nr:VCBS repeat-containing protein [Lysobacter solisilvae]QSX77927.1 VCBS repeat-containing protein [Lysobacter solisilvae]
MPGPPELDTGGRTWAIWRARRRATPASVARMVKTSAGADHSPSWWCAASRTSTSGRKQVQVSKPALRPMSGSPSKRLCAYRRHRFVLSAGLRATRRVCYPFPRDRGGAMKKVCWLAWLMLGFSGVACATEFSFGPPVPVVMSRDTFVSVAVGDVNGDGRDDLAATEVHNLSLSLQRADGSLAERVRVALPSAFNEHIYPLALVDLDRDGAREIVVGVAEGGPGLLVGRVGAGGTIALVPHANSHGCKFLVTGDVDGDGLADVLCHDWKQTATVFLGNGNGGFRSTLEFQTPAGTYSFDWKRMRLADVTGDGRPDLLVTSTTVNGFLVFPNNGGGGFLPPNVYPHPRSAAFKWPAALEVLDLDGDGVNEVVTASPDNAPDATLNVYRRGANGYLARAERIPVQSAPTAMLAGDVDGDGDNELIAAHFTFNSVTLLGSGTKGLAGQSRFDLPGFGKDLALFVPQGHSNSIALGDLDHDGCKDLASATRTGVQVLYGCRPAVRTRMAENDFDGDGMADVLWRLYTGGEAMLWGWAEIENWIECRQVMFYRTGNAMCPGFIAAEWQPQAFGDFDGDSAADVFWRNSSTGANEVWDHAIYKRAIGAVDSQSWQVVGAGDFDGDRRSDVLWRNTVTGANTVWKSANPATYQVLPAVTDERWKVAGIGDFNGDGRADILWRHASTGSNDLWPSGRRELRQALASVVSLQWQVAGIGDFDGDRKDDVLWRNAATGANDIWYSASLARRVAITRTSVEWVVTVGDYNGDGRADLLWHDPGTGENVIWRSADSRVTQAVHASGTDTRLVR